MASPHHPPPGNHNNDSDDDEFQLDSDLEELGTNDFPGYFVERDSRLFHSNVTSQYPLPVDTPEQKRMNVQHRILFEIMGALYPPHCPVPALLAPHPKRQRYVLDICTGTGQWVTDMAADYQHVAFRGFDLVPFATRYPPANVQFSTHDVNTVAPWQSGTFDIVHARSISMAVISYPALLAEAARLLRPSGCYIGGEWSRMLFTLVIPGPGMNPQPIPVTQQTAPFLAQFFAALHAALAAPPNPLPPTAPLVAPLLALQPQHYDASSITAATHLVPIGAWPQHPQNLQRTGRTYRNVFREYMQSVRPLLQRKSGLPDAVLGQIYAGAKVELRHTPGLLAVYNSVFARRI
ncbi:Methyltransf-25 domain-containing protein [Mycena kentingensis (nom. inval.)]|nr:Methyltransf-25 domain-containing protein [Mycena kentingensis (nom. inval.)]